jgi:hypothetical protein
VQLPAEAHATDVTPAFPPEFKAAVPGTSIAVPRRPFTWLATKPWKFPSPEPSV